MSVLRSRHTKPSINFGLGKTTLIVPVGTEVIVWQDSIYNEKNYSGNIAGEEIVSERINNNQYKLTCSNVGEFKVKVSIDSLDKKIKLISNTITLIVE